MKNLIDTIQEKLRLGKNTKIETDYKKLSDLHFGDDLFIYIKIKRVDNYKICKARRIKTDNNEFQCGYTLSYESKLSPIFKENIHYDNNSIIAGLYTGNLYYFIAADKDYFKPLDNEKCWNYIVNNFFTCDIKTDKKLKKYIDENITFD